MAAVLTAGHDAALSYRSAAAHLGLRPSKSRMIDVTCPRQLAKWPGIRFHRDRLPPDEVTTVRNVPVTTVPRTLLDLAAIADSHQLERAANEAETRQKTDPLSLDDLLLRYPRRQGRAAIRALLDERRIDAGITRSVLEERFLAFLEDRELPRPLLNTGIQLGDRWIEADCAWPRHKLVVELDSRSFHGTGQAFERDRARDRALLVEAWRVVRITWRALTREADTLERDLRLLLTEPSAQV